MGDKWVKVTILKHMISLYGSHFPGAIVLIPERTAINWAENGISVTVDNSGNPVEMVEEELETTPETEPEAIEVEEVEAEEPAAPVVKKAPKPKRKRRVK